MNEETDRRNVINSTQTCAHSHVLPPPFLWSPPIYISVLHGTNMHKSHIKYLRFQTKITLTSGVLRTYPLPPTPQKRTFFRGEGKWCQKCLLCLSQSDTDSSLVSTDPEERIMASCSVYCKSLLSKYTDYRSVLNMLRQREIIRLFINERGHDTRGNNRHFSMCFMIARRCNFCWLIDYWLFTLRGKYKRKWTDRTQSK